MGWSGGTQLFDDALDIFLGYIPKFMQDRLIEQWYEKFKDSDWDTEDESAYWDRLEPIMRKKYPHLFGD